MTIDPLDSKTLRQVRLSMGLSVIELSKLAGVHTTTIERIEKGQVDPKLNRTWAPIVRALQRYNAAE